jgi:hypothetical protein
MNPTGSEFDSIGELSNLVSLNIFDISDAGKALHRDEENNLDIGAKS